MPLKKCNHCGLHKNKVKFNRDRTKKDGRYSLCKSCTNLKRRQNYGKYSKSWKKRKRANQDYVYDLLSDACCEDCGESNIITLEFDHLDGSDKINNVSAMASGSLERLQREIDKCRILCSNCHKIRTAKQFDWYVLEYLEKRNSFSENK